MKRRRAAVFVLLFAALPIQIGWSDGVDLNIEYSGEFWRNERGGIAKGSRYLDNLDVSLSVDVAEAWGFGRGRLFAYGLYNNASTFSEELVGDSQTVSNIDAPAAGRLFEFWYELAQNNWSIRTGLYDLNSEFDAHETGSLFINSSHGIGAELAQTGENGPSIFPISSLALRWQYQFRNVGIRAAVLDAVPGNPGDPTSNRVELNGDDGLLLIAEIDWSVRKNWRIWSGAWEYSSDFERLAGGGAIDDNRGAYFGTEYATTVSGRQLLWFLRYGIANDEINPLSGYFGAGIVVVDPLGKGVDDRLGLAIGLAEFGEDYREVTRDSGQVPARRERNWELTYRHPVNDWLALQPNIQYVQYPSATKSIDDALVLGLRFELAWEGGW